MPRATDNGRRLLISLPATAGVHLPPVHRVDAAGLLGRDPWKPDEAYSFGLVYHILQSGDWVIPTLAQEPFMEKPPLFYLTAALFAAPLAGCCLFTTPLVSRQRSILALPSSSSG